MVESDFSYVFISNIPLSIRSAQLRVFFSEYVEDTAFKCFHFKHRLQLNNDRKKTNVCCAFVAIYKAHCCDFIRQYNNQRWLNKDGSTMDKLCKVSEIERVLKYDDFPAFFKSAERKDDGTVHVEDLLEMKPPADIMPQGNVGTPLRFFQQAIRDCRLPPTIVKKLELNFPRSLRQKLYSSVAFNYGDTEKPSSSTFPIPSKDNWRELTAQYRRKQLPNGPRIEVLDEDAPEDWERHESLHKDVTEQERTKQRLYEEELEVVWEKGGSGLVHYTDATYWDEEAGDFDEKTTDDWDVDMTYSDKDGRDWLTMQRERKRHKANHDDGTFPKGKARKREQSKPIRRPPEAKGQSSDYARKLMERMGWREGSGLGKNSSGIVEPINTDSQKPGDLSGLGYRGEKLQ